MSALRVGMKIWWNSSTAPTPTITSQFTNGASYPIPNHSSAANVPNAAAWQILSQKRFFSSRTSGGSGRKKSW